MDVLSHFHATPTYIDAARTVSTMVRWYPAAAGAKPFPEQHAFGSPVWEPNRGEFDFGPSCVFNGLKHRSRRFAGPNGQHYHGELEWFKHGLPAEVIANIADYERPECPGYERRKVFSLGVTLQSAIIGYSPISSVLKIGVSLSSAIVGYSPISSVLKIGVSLSSDVPTGDDSIRVLKVGVTLTRVEARETGG